MGKKEDNIATFENVAALKETSKALLVSVDGNEIWMPKSQIHDDSEVYHEGHEGKLVVTQWIAEQKGLV